MEIRRSRLRNIIILVHANNKFNNKIVLLRGTDQHWKRNDNSPPCQPHKISAKQH